MRLPLTRHGWREMLVGTLLLAGVAGGLAYLWRPLAMLAIPPLVFLLAFFRDPDRPVPAGDRVFVSPADGTVSDITEVAHDELLGGPAVRIGIFLSVFNVHVNRSPCGGRVLQTRYAKGKFINAMRHDQASSQNESNTIVLTNPAGDRPVAVVKQIVGLIARRIVCTVSPGDQLQRGQRIGMIKFGSRTELVLPKWLEPRVSVKVGQSVRGAADVIATAEREIG
jgi:phosphatidylserine decarboxylase